MLWASCHTFINPLTMKGWMVWLDIFSIYNVWKSTIIVDTVFLILSFWFYFLSELVMWSWGVTNDSLYCVLLFSQKVWYAKYTLSPFLYFQLRSRFLGPLMVEEHLCKPCSAYPDVYGWLPSFDWRVVTTVNIDMHGTVWGPHCHPFWAYTSNWSDYLLIIKTLGSGFFQIGNFL